MKLSLLRVNPPSARWKSPFPSLSHWARRLLKETLLKADKERNSVQEGEEKPGV